jgi:hypothetical protein
MMEIAAIYLIHGVICSSRINVNTGLNNIYNYTKYVIMKSGSKNQETLTLWQ